LTSLPGGAALMVIVSWKAARPKLMAVTCVPFPAGSRWTVDHDDETFGLRRRQVDLLAFVDTVFGTHAQQLLELRGERPGALELLGQRPVEHLGTRQFAARSRGARILAEQVVGPG
jgi:hypothetical protein